MSKAFPSLFLGFLKKEKATKSFNSMAYEITFTTFDVKM